MNQFLTAQDISELCGVSLSKAYKILKQMNRELSEQGYLTIAGKVPRRFFEEKLYGGIKE